MQRTPLRHLLILDFEATCGDGVEDKQEIIEFPTLVYNLEKDEVQATFHEYVRPIHHPTLTEFCTKLTGIEQNIVDAAEPFDVVWSRYRKFIEDNDLVSDASSYAFLTCGNWDLQSMLPRQLDLSGFEDDLQSSGVVVSPFNRFINVKNSYRKYYKQRYQKGMVAMLKGLQMEMEGRHHSGIDDCKNILRIVRRMRENGWMPSEEDTTTLG